MSNFDDPEYVGHKHPPRAHRFSNTNQPKRRGRGKKNDPYQDADLIRHIREALSEEVGISQNGRAGRAKVVAAWAKKIVNQACNGTMSDSMKLAKFLKDCGLLDVNKLLQDLREEHDERLEQANKKCEELAEALGSLIPMAHMLIEDRRFATTTFFEARDRCSCGAFDQCEPAVERFHKWHEEDEEDEDDNLESEASGSDDLNWHPGSSSVFGAQANKVPFKIIKTKSAPEDDPDDEFYTGMLGND